MFHNCPITFICKNITEWYKCYQYYKMFPSAPMPGYDHVSKKWVDTVNIYENKLSEFQMMLIGKP